VLAGNSSQQRQPACQVFFPFSAIGEQKHPVGDITLPYQAGSARVSSASGTPAIKGSLKVWTIPADTD